MENWLEWLGYTASAVVLISLLMTSIKKLRWINLVGALMFGTYGFMISSIPTGVMNLGIALIDIYFLVKMYQSKDYFKLLSVESDSDYLTSFIDFYKEDIENFQSINNLSVTKAALKVFTLRNMNPAGILVGNKYSQDTLEIVLDYAVPQYRDFKLGKYLFHENQDFFTTKGYHSLVSFTSVEAHIEYLEKMGFKSQTIDGKIGFIKVLKKGE